MVPLRQPSDTTVSTNEGAECGLSSGDSERENCGDKVSYVAVAQGTCVSRSRLSLLVETGFRLLR